MKVRRFFLLGVCLAALLPTARAQKGVRQKDAPAVIPEGHHEDGSKAQPVATPPPATLRWNNGESLPGAPAGATADCLLWRTPFFDEPLELAWNALHRLDQSVPDRAPAEEFAFVLRDGSRLYGNLTAWTDATVGVRSQRHGDVSLRRAEVLCAWRLRGKGLVYAGPLGESGWTAVPNVRLESENTSPAETLGQVPTRRIGPGGALVLPFWHRTVSAPIALPDRAEVSFQLHAEEAPAFQLVLDTRDKKRLRVETWGNEVVLTVGRQFQKVCELGPDERRVALRVRWDRPAKRCQVYTSGGKLLTEWTVPDASSEGKAAVLILNKGRSLTLDRLRVREWDGQGIAPADADGPRVELADGRTVAGTVAGLADGALTLDTSGGSTTVALVDVDMMVLSDDLPAAKPHDSVLAWADGTLLQGDIADLQDGRARLKTTFTDEPLPTGLDDLRQLLVPAGAPSSDPPLASLDRLVLGDTTLHGRLVAADGATPRWQAVGGRNVVTPAPAAVSEIVRVLPTEAATPATSLLFTRLGDVLPGTLRGLDRQEVEFDSPLVEVKKLPVAQLQAVQFDAAGRGAINGFDAAGWRMLKGAPVTVAPGTAALKLSPEVGAGHPEGAQEGEVRFVYDTESYSCLRLRLFCDGTNSARALNYILMRSGNHFTVGVEEADGQFNSQHQTAGANGPTPVRLTIDEKSVRCYVNDALTDTVWFPAARRAGTGLILEASGVWGNAAEEVILSKFSAVASAGQSSPVSVNADARTQALTVPRARRDDPPRHALLAHNGDVLRGEVVAITNTQIDFRLGLETLRVPRERVAAVIALQPPAAAPADDAEAEARRKLLGRRVPLQTSYGNVGYSSLLSIVRQAVPELKFQLPAATDSRRVQFRFDNQTVGEVLDSVCELFELRYHLEKGVVILEARGREVGVASLVHRTYWLKTDPFTGHGTPSEVLTAHGVTFPRGAATDWQESARTLEIVNTTANQDKAAALLAGELGGVLGSPTHWLLLRNGGRLGLTVERFERDAVLGTHPLYGRCRVPMADVYAVRNTLPEPTAAARAVGGWQTTFAPEPVLPESGGEGSELLGKDAPSFKLKTLEGGEFDLGAQRGKVVVLDFWATWCGPCIKSLPGLMEAMGRFPADKVRLVGVNQAEAPEGVKRFLEVHGWQLAVALDAGQAVAKQYGVDGIPHTVIVGPDGKVAWVHTGAAPDADEQAAAVVKKLLGEPTETPYPTPKNNPTTAGSAGKRSGRDERLAPVDLSTCPSPPATGHSRCSTWRR